MNKEKIDKRKEPEGDNVELMRKAQEVSAGLESGGFLAAGHARKFGERMGKILTGTREWSDASLNVGVGCHCDCRACYAAANALRFGIIKSRDDWKNERLRRSAISVRRDAEIIMSPTTHDISDLYAPELFRRWLIYLHDGRKLLIVSKWRLDMAQRFAATFRPLGPSTVARIEVRATITTMDESTAAWWEPGAPPPAERVEALRTLHAAGFKTSVSAEPLLGGMQTVLEILEAVDSYRTRKRIVTGAVWIGPLNRMEQRVENWQEHERARVLRTIQTPAWAREMMSEITDPRVEWKDGMRTLAARAE